MNIAVINGQNHRGTTWRAGKALADEFGGKTAEFFLPKDFSDFCIGCGNCFTKGEEFCPHYSRLKPLTDAMDEADVLIFTSPVYVYHVTGAMKNFLDHCGYQWIIHRPKPEYFGKQAVLITTAAGSGTKSTLKDMEDSMFFWGIGQVCKLRFNVHALSPDHVSRDMQEKMTEKIKKTADKIKKNGMRRHSMPLKAKMLFELMRKLHAKGSFSEIDNEYWKEHGWI